MEKSSSVVVIQLEFEGNIAIYVLPPGTADLPRLSSSMTEQLTLT